MRITYDRQAQAAYIYLSDALVITTRRISDVVLVDLDADANVVGIELLDVDPPLMLGVPEREPPVCQDCGMRHKTDDAERCIEGHGDDGTRSAAEQ